MCALLCRATSRLKVAGVHNSYLGQVRCATNRNRGEYDVRFCGFFTTICTDRSHAHDRPLTPINLCITQQTPLTVCCAMAEPPAPAQLVASRGEIKKSFAKIVPLARDVVTIEWPSEE
jgi:hypothetical protein